MALVVLVGLTTLGVAPCGAEDVNAPADPPIKPAVCPAPREVAPTFYKLLDDGAFQGLADVVYQSLSVCTSNGQVVQCTDPSAEPPAAGVLIGGVLHDIGSFANDPPEVTPGAKPGQAGYCAATEAQAPTPPNRLCLMKRGTELLIVRKDANGKPVLVDAFDKLQPLVAGLLRYIDGTLPASPGDHYDILPVMQHVVLRCDDQDFTDLLHGLLVWLAPPNGQNALDAVQKLLDNPDMKAFLAQIDVQNDVGKAGFVALIKTIIDTLRRQDFTPADLDNTLQQTIYPFIQQSFPNNNLEGDLKGVVAVLDDVLDPNRTPNVLHPLQNVLDCSATADPNDVVLGTGYDLLVVSDVVTLDQLIDSLHTLLDLDPDGTLLLTADVLVEAFSKDRDTRDALDTVINVLLQEPNARKVVPVLVKLLESDVVSEVVGIADLLFGGCGPGAAGP